MQQKTGIKHTLTRILVRSWWHLPLSRQGREAVKTLMFNAFPFLFSNTRVYRNWDYSRKLSNPDFSFRAVDFPSHWPMKQVNPQAYIHDKQAGPVTPLAVIVHVFYPDLFREILGELKGISPNQCKLFVSTTKESRKSVEGILNDSTYRYHLMDFPNRGRDILPFLRLSALAIEEGYPLLLKLHTKQQDHRMSGDVWRKELYSKLLKPEALERIQGVFMYHAEVGLLGPAGHILPMGLYYGSNYLATSYLSYRLRVEPQTLQKVHFVAGSMFYIRARALQPLLDLDLGDDFFEEEEGQHDGTMAHAVERIFTVSNQVAGYKLADTTSKSGDPGFQETKAYRFTW